MRQGNDVEWREKEEHNRIQLNGMLYVYGYIEDRRNRYNHQERNVNSVPE